MLPILSPLDFNCSSTSKWATKLLPKESTRLCNFISNYQLNRLLRKHDWGHQQRVRVTPHYQPKGKPDTRREMQALESKTLDWNILSQQELPLDLRQEMKPFSPAPRGHSPQLLSCTFSCLSLSPNHSPFYPFLIPLFVSHSHRVNSLFSILGLNTNRDVVGYPKSWVQVVLRA